MNEETYLGDGVYASFNGYQIKLRTGDGRNQVIYLEPGVFEALVTYHDELQKNIRRQMESHDG